MSDRQYQFTHAVDEGCLGWQVNVTMPYVAAYDSAYSKFRETVDKQAAVEKARVELFITAASIVTGSVLMATVASSSLRAVAGNVALDIVCRNNLDKTFAAPALRLQGVRPDRGRTRGGWAEGGELCGAAQGADRQPPPAALDADRLSKKIELCFYMKTILDSDELIDWPASSNLSPYPSTVGVTSHPIPQLPGAPDYPHPAPPKIGYGVTPAYQSIGISRPGSEIRSGSTSCTKTSSASRSTNRATSSARFRVRRWRRNW